MNEINVTLNLYGAYRDLAEGDSITLTFKKNSTLKELKGIIKNKFSSELIYQSVFANEDTILPDSMQLQKDITLSVLPPVCGG